MKKLANIIVGITLLSGAAYADFKDEVAIQSKKMYSDFKMRMRADTDLKVGKNNLKVQIKHQDHNFVNADITLEVDFNGQKTVYNYTDVSNLGYYKFPVDFSQNGVYKYSIKFGKAGFPERRFLGQLTI